VAAPAHAATTAPAHAATTETCSITSAFSIPKADNVRGHGWHEDFCVGTVDVSLYYTKGSLYNPFCKDASLEIRSTPGRARLWHGEKQLCGYAGYWNKYPFRVYSSFVNNVESYISACARSTYHPAWTCRKLD
jgi:hypothetical protein